MSINNDNINKLKKKDYPFSCDSNNKISDFPTPGEYISIVTKVYYPDEYANNGAVKFEYILEDNESHKKYSFKETFLILDNYERFDKFYNYIDSLDFDVNDFTDLIGLREKVILKYENRGSGIFTNIVQREYLSFEPQNDKKSV